MDAGLPLKTQFGPMMQKHIPMLQIPGYSITIEGKAILVSNEASITRLPMLISYLNASVKSPLSSSDELQQPIMSC